jgi:hypothetical protein
MADSPPGHRNRATGSRRLETAAHDAAVGQAAFIQDAIGSLNEFSDLAQVYRNRPFCGRLGCRHSSDRFPSTVCVSVSLCIPK